LKELEQVGGLIQNPTKFAAQPGLAKPAVPAAVCLNRTANPSIVIRIMSF